MIFDDLNVGTCIRSARIKKNYSQEYLAELIQITPTHLKHIESGHRKPSIEVYFELAHVLDFSTDAMILGQEDDALSQERRELQLLMSKLGAYELKVLRATGEALLGGKESGQ